MVFANGTGSSLKPPERMRFSVVPRTEILEVERPNPFKVNEDDPETIVVELTAYPKGPGCPAWVDIEVEAAHDTYRAALQQEMARREAAAAEATREYLDQCANDGTEPNPDFTPSPPQVTHLLSEAIAALRRDLLHAVIEGLDKKEASFLVRDGGPWEDVLVHLGWWTRIAAPAADTEEAASESPEAAGEAATASSSPDSASSTARTRGKR